MLARQQRAPQAAQEHRPLSGLEVPDRAAEERDQPRRRPPPRAAGRDAPRSRRPPRAGPGRDTARRARRAPRATRSRSRPAGTYRRSVPARVSASSSSRVFADEPDPSSTSVVAPVSRAISSTCAVSSARFGARRVVLGQCGDLLEQLAAPRVVEPLRRQLLGLRRQPEQHVGAQVGAGVRGSEVDVDPGGPGGHAIPFRPSGGRDAGGVRAGVQRPDLTAAGGGDDQVSVRDGDPAGAGVGGLGRDAPRPPRPRTDRACVQVVAPIVVPSVSSRFSRTPGPRRRRSTRGRPARPPGRSPARSRWRARAQSTAESVGASRVSRSVTGSRPARPASAPGQPRDHPVVAEQPRPVGERRGRRRGDRHAGGRRAHRGEHAGCECHRARARRTRCRPRSGRSLR